MSRNIHNLSALRGRIGAPAVPARPLRSFTPEQQRLIRALVGAARTEPGSGSATAAQQPSVGGAR